MYKDIKEDIPVTPKSINISLFGNKLKVGIIGAGKGALIKVRTFLDKQCNVEVLALDFIEAFKELEDENVKLIQGTYNRGFINDKHIIIIAIDDKEVVNEIIKDCDSLSKIYINSTSFKEGGGVIPVTKESATMTICVNTKLGNPKASVFMANKILDFISEYDDLIKFTSDIRNNINIDKIVKEELINFINTEDFEFCYKKDKHIQVLRLFYNYEILQKIIS